MFVVKKNDKYLTVTGIFVKDKKGWDVKKFEKKEDAKTAVDGGKVEQVQ